MKMEQTECSEMSACKIQTPGNYPEESIQHSERGESLKSRMTLTGLTVTTWQSLPLWFILKWSLHILKCLTGPWDTRWTHRSRGWRVWHLKQATYGPHRIRCCEGDARRHCRAHQARECPLNCGPKHHHHSLIYRNTVIFIIRHFLESREVATIENS